VTVTGNAGGISKLVNVKYVVTDPVLKWSVIISIVRIYYLCWAHSHNCEKWLLASSCPSVHPSVRRHGTTRLRLDGFWWNLIFELFRKSVEKIPNKITGTLNEDVFTFMTVSREMILRMRNVLGEGCRENENTHFMFNNFFPKKTMR
jgi:hypothetical protein